MGIRARTTEAGQPAQRRWSGRGRKGGQDLSQLMRCGWRQMRIVYACYSVESLWCFVYIKSCMSMCTRVSKNDSTNFPNTALTLRTTCVESAPARYFRAGSVARGTTR